MNAFEGGMAPRGSETILLVDPEPEPRKLAAFMLTKQGYQVVEARSAVEALKQFAACPAIDLLVTEILMPYVSGSVLAGQLRDLQPGLRVLYMSHAGPGKTARHIELPFLQKPFTMRVLAGKVREVLDEPKAKALGMHV
jgi:DNA-binding NtrC family response regulator